MRRVASIALVLAAAAGAGLLAGPADATSCALVVEWDGRTYWETRYRGQLVYSETLGDGVVPACDPSMGDRDQPVPVAAAQPVDPQYAIVVARRLFVAEGFPVPLPQHPAHDLVYGSPSEPDERRNCQAEATSMEDELRAAPTFSLSMQGHPEPIALDARTRLEGLRELNEGDRVRVEALTCEGEGPGTTLLVAASIEVLDDVAPGAAGGAVDRDVVLAVAVTAVLFAVGFAVRRLRRRDAAGDSSAA